MIIAGEERSSRGPLIVFLDLLFLLVAFFTLLLFFLQERHQLSDRQLEAVQQQLSRVVGEEVQVPEALDALEMVVERFITAQEAEMERERERAERRKRRAARTTVKLEYQLDAGGRIVYDGRPYGVRSFLEQVVKPLRAEHWVAFRAYAAPQTPFGDVVAHRRVLLKDSNEFDTYWDNVTRERAEQPTPDR